VVENAISMIKKWKISVVHAKKNNYSRKKKQLEIIHAIFE
jgi:hypothetical protein